MREDDPIEYITGLAEFDRLAHDATFLDFVGMYDAGGAHRERGAVSFSTSEPDHAALAAHWMRRMSGSRVGYLLDFEEGQDVVELVRFWARRLGVDHERLRLCRRSFGELLALRSGPSDYGEITIRAADPVLRIRLQVWMDKVRAELARSPCSTGSPTGPRSRLTTPGRSAAW